MHVTIFRQDQPKAKDRSIYEVFERINTGGLRLSAQEIRTCISHGNFVEKLHEIAGLEQWRSVYGNRSPRLKDEELILRFFAFFERRDIYSRPMSVFLDEFLDDNKDISDSAFNVLAARFSNSLQTLIDAVGTKLFRPQNALNAAVFDSIMVGCAVRLEAGSIHDGKAVRTTYEQLLNSDEFKKYYQRATADDESVKNRMKLSIDAFAIIK